MQYRVNESPGRPLSKVALWLATIGALMMTGCVQPWNSFQTGTAESTVVARFGAPKETYPLPNGGRRLMWPTQPMGETNTVADIDASGKLVSLKQVLQDSEFYKAEIGVWTKNDVVSRFGKPEETAYFRLMKREVYSYRYYEDDTWYMLFHFYFDDAGILRTTQKTMDPLHDPDRRFF